MAIAEVYPHSFENAEPLETEQELATVLEFAPVPKPAELTQQARYIEAAKCFIAAPGVFEAHCLRGDGDKPLLFVSSHVSLQS